MRFRMPDGEEFDGVWQPFWCGSDCPCDVAGESDEPFADEPECWCAYRAGEKFGMYSEPTHWMPLPPSPNRDCPISEPIAGNPMADDLIERCAQVAEGPVYKERYRGVEGHNEAAESSLAAEKQRAEEALERVDELESESDRVSTEF